MVVLNPCGKKTYHPKTLIELAKNDPPTIFRMLVAAFTTQRSAQQMVAYRPSIQPGNDADTGIFHPSDANNIGFSTTGEERVRLMLVGKRNCWALTNPDTSFSGR